MRRRVLALLLGPELMLVDPQTITPHITRTLERLERRWLVLQRASGFEG